ncbi:MAG: transglutaminase domain-containing protein [Planctomycetes bacterium]|nr:transglutaminase domain-containing protein [Planctomycetota bacterium]
MKLRLFAVLALLLAFASTHVAEPQSRIERSYLIYFSGSRVGWVKTSREVFQEGERSLLREKESMYVKIVRSWDGQSFTIAGETETVLTAEGALVRKDETSDNGAQRIRRSAEVAEGKITITERVDGDDPRKFPVDTTGATVMTSRQAWAALAGRLQKGQTLKFSSLDLENHKLAEETWTVNGPAERRTREGDNLKGTEVLVLRDGRSERNLMDENGDPRVSTLMGGFSVEETKAIPKNFVAEPVSIESAMTSDVVVPGCFGLQQMEIEIEGTETDAEGLEALFESNAYQQVVRYDDKQGGGWGLRLLSRKPAKDFVPAAFPPAEVPDDVKPFAKPTAICQSDDPEIAAQAAKSTKGAKDSRDAADRLVRFVDSYLTKASGDTGSASAKQAWRERQGDCTEHAVLFTAMARAVGLPARCIGGLVYVSDEASGTALFGYHAWAEVWIGQWVPVDATVKELGTSARYVMFSVDEPGQSAGSGRISRCIGLKIRPRINAWTLESGKTWRRKDAREFKFPG